MKEDCGVLYTIEIDWVNKVVVLNLPETNGKVVITRKDSMSISSCFEVMDIKRKAVNP